MLIDVAAAGLCHSDLHFMQAKFKQKVPAVLGHESAGVVARGRRRRAPRAAR